MSERTDTPEAGAFLPFCRPSIDESDVAAVTATLRSGWITTGPACAELEEAICARTGAAFAVAVTSGTAAMHLALTAMDIGPGDEVITPSMTWVSTPNIIAILGATPVFVDVDRDTLLVSPEAVAAAVTARTRAIIPVHYAGAPCRLDDLRQVAHDAGAQLIEDAAHAIGTRFAGAQIGATGHAIFSLHPIKNITTGEGGIFVSDDAELASRVRQLRFHGLGAEAWDRNQQGRSPQVEVQSPGYKYNLPDMNAVLGVSQLKRLDQFIEKRARIAQRYHAAFEHVDGLSPLALPDHDHDHAWHLFVVRVLDNQTGLNRDAFMQALAARGIGTGIHFKAVHTHRWYRERDLAAPGGLDNTTWNSERICSIPLFPDMTDDDVDRVISAVADVCRMAEGATA